ncbi:hypothetical protein L1049_015900 [Liquidambar formosana]|uniref:Bromo domain-containing protein n=1 Tax=Liquidambar formosana TaxID=63359 RepID=A0AAP0S4U4_LIQFO
MKRKRGHGKRKPKKPPVVGANEAHQNVVTLNKEDNSGLGDFDAAEYDSVMEADMPPTAGTDQPDKFANSNLDELVDKTVRQVFCGRAKVSHRTSKSDYQPTSDVPTQSDTGKNRQQLPSGKQVVVTEEMEDSANSLREIKVAISRNPSNKAGSIKRKSSRGLVSSSINRTTNAEVEQGERPHPKEPNVPLLDPQYNMQELNAALAVIKKVMKIDAAEPFNVPVNPITLGIPDYFDVIDTPMDFGTICRNLENGVKYMNSEDVFKDVQYIWENCYKYNNKGDYIMELMKRVRKNFTKYWAAAGLYSEQSRSTNGHLHLPPSMDTAMRPSRHVPRCPVGPMNGSPSQQQDQLGSSQQQDQLGPSHHQKDRLGPSQNQQPPTGYGQPYRTPLSSSLPQPSQPLSAHSHSLPCTDSAMRCNRCVPRCPVGPIIGSTHQHQQDQSGLSQPQSQKPPPSYSQLQPSQPQASANTESAGHSYFSPPTDSASRHIRHVTRFPVGPMTSNPIQQQPEDQPGPTKSHHHQPQQPPPSYIQQYQPQSSSSQLPPSLPQVAMDSESAGHFHLTPPTDSAIRRRRYVPRCPVGPMSVNPCKQQKDHPGWSHPHPQHSQHSPPSCCHSYQPQRSSGQPQVIADTGHSHLPPPTDSVMRRRRYVPRCPVGPMTFSPCKEQQDHSGWSHCPPQHPQRSPPSCSHSHQPQRSSGRPQAIADTGHSHLPPPTDSAMRPRRYVPRCPVGPMTVNPCKQPQDRSGWSHPQPQHPQHSPPSCSQPYQPQLSSGQPQTITDTDSALRHNRHVPTCPVGPMTSNPSQQDQSCSCQPQPQQHTPIYSQSDQSQSSSSQSQVI